MAPEKEPETREKCYDKAVGEEATFLESAMDYLNQFKAMPAQKHWICLKNYFSQKCSSISIASVLFLIMMFFVANLLLLLSLVFGKHKVEPVVKDETPEVAKPAAVGSR
ncbi:uncharacterized protein C2845_PM01G28690 [Panicum miliaceum]|uniref:Uncharacterized protein n=1 Tax=Panicum miliaceum TaxID=4540 RepID=A0A3L6TSQ5_PANMI|nr:uncharacterized protein C2845_PM01G28690 [Panicum miliaceum]